MAQCEKCGRGGMGLIHTAVRFKDKKYICVNCLKELGYDHPVKEATYLSLHTSEEILHPEIRWKQQAQETNQRRGDRLGIEPDQYGALDKANATDFEIKLFARVCALLRDEGCDTSVLSVAPGNNGSLIVMKEGTVILEYKGEPDIKWIRLADDPDNKVRFGQLSKLNALADRIIEIYRSN